MKPGGLEDDMTLLPTTMVGSYPRPNWFTHQLDGRDLLEAFKVIHHAEAYEDATRTVIKDQELAGLDILADGPNEILERLTTVARTHQRLHDEQTRDPEPRHEGGDRRRLEFLERLLVPSLETAWRRVGMELLVLRGSLDLLALVRHFVFGRLDEHRADVIVPLASGAPGDLPELARRCPVRSRGRRGAPS